jgi:cytochrome oxidase Cu insertion factor (SCO1/SenC/PrrC family)
MNTGIKLKSIYISIIILFLLAVSALIVIELANRSRADLPVLGEVPAFEFTERSGSVFGKNDMKGTINIVNFFFTNC